MPQVAGPPSAIHSPIRRLLVITLWPLIRCPYLLMQLLRIIMRLLNKWNQFSGCGVMNGGKCERDRVHNRQWQTVSQSAKFHLKGPPGSLCLPPGDPPVFIPFGFRPLCVCTYRQLPASLPATTEIALLVKYFRPAGDFVAWPTADRRMSFNGPGFSAVQLGGCGCEIR